MGRLARIALIALTLLAGTAAAENKADALFKQGKKLMSEKRYADACSSFEQSQKIDPEIGTELNVAKCFEEWGKLGRALRAYQKAEDMAKQAKDSRLAKIHELIEQLDPTVPRLTLKVSADADTSDLSITLDGNAIDKSELGQAQVVDPGPHLVEWKTHDAKKKNKVVPVERGSASEVALEVPPKSDKAKPDTKPDTKPEKAETKPDGEHVAKTEPDHTAKPAAPDPGRNRRYAAYGFGGGGAALVVVSSILTLSAKSKYDDALKKDCGGMTNMCNATGLAATHSARTEANVATVLFLLGAGSIGVGAWLYLTPTTEKHPAERTSQYFAPTVSSDGAGLVFGGSL